MYKLLELNLKSIKYNTPMQKMLISTTILYVYSIVTQQIFLQVMISIAECFFNIKSNVYAF